MADVPALAELAPVRHEVNIATPGHLTHGRYGGVATGVADLAFALLAADTPLRAHLPAAMIANARANEAGAKTAMSTSSSRSTTMRPIKILVSNGRQS